MSKFAEAWAEKVTTGSSGRKQILDKLAYRANHPHWVCWPSNADLERVTEQKRSTVRANLKKLEEDGFIIRIERRRTNGTMQTSAIIVLGEPFNEIVDQIEATPSLPYVVSELLPDLKKLVLEQQPAPDISAGEETAENGEKPTSAKIPQVVDSAQPAPEFDPLELKLNNNSSPLSPPKGGDEVHYQINEFKPGPSLVADMCLHLSVPEDFIRFAAGRWKQQALESGQRIRSTASNFKRWLYRHKGLAGLRAEWWAQVPDCQKTPKPKPIGITQEMVLATGVGKRALAQFVGGIFAAACIEANCMLGDDDLQRIIDERQETRRVISSKGAFDQRMLKTHDDKERALTEKHLSAVEAAE